MILRQEVFLHGFEMSEPEVGARVAEHFRIRADQAIRAVVVAAQRVPGPFVFKDAFFLMENAFKTIV